MKLTFVKSLDDIYQTIQEFNKSLKTNLEMASNLSRLTTYWVYDKNTQTFGPAKFIGFSNMTFDLFRLARNENPPAFDGHRTKKVIEKITGLVFQADKSLADSLDKWAESSMAKGIFTNIKHDKWSFIKISAANDTPIHFIPLTGIPALLKHVGKSQFQDGVRIDEAYHVWFNPPYSKYFASRGSKREVEILFNGKVFSGHYVFEGTSVKKRKLQRIQFSKSLKDEFRKVFPREKGYFIIQVGSNLNHFLFIHKNI